MNQDNPTNGFNSGSGSDTGSSSSLGTTSSSEIETCGHCGSSLSKEQNNGIEQFLGKIGISEEMITNLKSSMQNIDVEEYLNTAREYLKTTGNKATTFTKENPGKIAAGVAVLAVGAGLLISALGKDEKRR